MPTIYIQEDGRHVVGKLYVIFVGRFEEKNCSCEEEKIKAFGGQTVISVQLAKQPPESIMLGCLSIRLLFDVAASQRPVS